MSEILRLRLPYGHFIVLKDGAPLTKDGKECQPAGEPATFKTDKEAEEFIKKHDSQE